MTLEVERLANDVFPVVVGLGIEGGTFHVTAEGPKSEAELHREEERVEREEREIEQIEREGRTPKHGPNYHNAFSTLLISRLGPPILSEGLSSRDHEFDFSSLQLGRISAGKLG